MSTGLLLTSAIALIAGSLYLILSEEIQRVLAATVLIVCLLVCLVAAPLPIQGLILLGILVSSRHRPLVDNS